MDWNLALFQILQGTSEMISNPRVSQYTFTLLSLFLGVISFFFLVKQQEAISSWLIDDAGISFAFSRNLLKGELVHQLGAPPVEGFSNPLWVILVSAILAIYPSDISILKSLSWCFFIYIFIRLTWAGRSDKKILFKHSLIFFFLAINPSIFIWSFSGLENGLLLLLGIELLLIISSKTITTISSATAAGVIASLLCLTRPEGLIYSLVYPTCAIIAYKRKGSLSNSSVTIALLIPFITFTCYSIFRYFYFGDLVANTYYAKAIPLTVRINDFLSISDEFLVKTQNLLQVCFSVKQIALLLFPIGIMTFESLRKHPLLWSEVKPLLVFLTISYFVYLYLPSDWMPEFRFATLFFPCFYWLFTTIFLQEFSFVRSLFLLLLIIICLQGSAQRFQRFIECPTISISEVQERNRYFTAWSNYAALTNKPSILIADIGGALIDDTLTIVDLGMLCDKTIAKTLGESNIALNKEKFWDYIFREKKPLFISTRAYHSWIADLDSDPRFRADYTPIHEYKDLWILQKKNSIQYSGDYIRKEVVQDNYILEKMRNDAKMLYYPFDTPSIK